MRKYTVLQVAELLETNPETVRRWIRGGQLPAEQSSRKGGNIIDEQSLTAFLKSTPKYAARAEEKGFLIQQPIQITVTDRVPESGRMRMFGAVSPKHNKMSSRNNSSKFLEANLGHRSAQKMEKYESVRMPSELHLEEVAAVLEYQQRKIMELERRYKNMESQLDSKGIKRK